jgi:hypothetical protein
MKGDDFVLNSIANIDVKEIEYDQNKFPTFNNSVCQESFSKAE